MFSSQTILKTNFHVFQNRGKAVDPKVTSAPDYRGDRPGPGTGEVMQLPDKTWLGRIISVEFAVTLVCLLTNPVSDRGILASRCLSHRLRRFHYLKGIKKFLKVYCNEVSYQLIYQNVNLLLVFQISCLGDPSQFCSVWKYPYVIK